MIGRKTIGYCSHRRRGARRICGCRRLPARADAVADFYKGKQISLIIGTSSGNDYDFRARLLARHMGRFIPGEPTHRSAQHAGRRRHQRRQLARQCRAA